MGLDQISYFFLYQAKVLMSFKKLQQGWERYLNNKPTSMWDYIVLVGTTGDHAMRSWPTTELS